MQEEEEKNKKGGWGGGGLEGRERRIDCTMER